jgi:hypothetical protein
MALPIRSLVAGAVVLLLAGCAQARPAGGRPPRVTAAALAALVARTGGYYTDQVALDTAEAARTDACMARHGFRYPTSGPATITRDEEWRPDLAERRTHGYGLAPTAAEPAGAADAYLRGLPTADQRRFDRAMSGTARGEIGLWDGERFTYGADGCLAGARAAIYGSAAAATAVFYLPQVVFNDLYQVARRDRGYTGALARWQGCMARSGHRYASPGAARQAFVAEYGRSPDPAAVRPREIAVAVADAGCATEAGLPDTVVRLVTRGLAGLPAAARDQLATAAACRAAAVRRIEGRSG